MVVTDNRSRLDASRFRVTLVPAGDLDAGTLEDFATSVQVALCSGAHEVEVDLTDVGFMDTETLRILESARESLESRSGHLCLLNPTPPVKRLLELTAF